MPAHPVRLDELITHVAQQYAGAGPLGRLTEAVLLSGRLGEIADHLIGHYVDEARAAGSSWTEIGQSLGVTKQAAQKRFVPRADGAEPDLLASGASRFTRPARRALVGAQQEALATGAPAVGTEHVLVALLGQPGTAAVQALVAAGADPATVRTTLGTDQSRTMSPAGLEPGDGGPAHLPFDAACKQAGRLALRHALRMDSVGVTTGHVLLGLLDTEGRARAVLLDTGLRADAVEDWLRRSDPSATGEV